MACGGRTRLVPAERIAARRRVADLAFPGQLERPRRRRGAASSRAGRGMRSGQALGSDAGLLELGPALVGLCPQEVGRRLDVVGLVDDPDLVVSGGRGRSSGARWPAQTSAASASWPCSRRARSAARSAGSSSRCPAQPVAQRALRLATRAGTRSPAAGATASTGANAALVGRVEGAQRLDLVTEPLDAHGQRLTGREDVDDAAAARELAPPGDLGQTPRSPGRSTRAARAPARRAAAARERQRLRGQLVRREGVLEECLHAGDEDARPARRATPPVSRRAPRSRRGPARSARTPARCAARA